VAQDLTDILHDLRDTNNSLLAAKQNETSKTFTLIAFLTMPATLFYTIVSLPTKEKHIFNQIDNDFTVIMIVSFILFLGMLSFTIYKKW
jgi:Mg2+ and Co2+ transporter CorA